MTDKEDTHDGDWQLPCAGGCGENVWRNERLAHGYLCDECEKRWDDACAEQLAEKLRAKGQTEVGE